MWKTVIKICRSKCFKSNEAILNRASACVLMVLWAMYGGEASGQESLGSEVDEVVSISGWMAEHTPDLTIREVNFRNVTVYAGNASKSVEHMQVELTNENDAAHLTIFSQDGVGRTITVSAEDVRLYREKDVSDLFVDGVSGEWLLWGEDAGSSTHQAEGDPCKLFPELPACEERGETDG